MPTIEGNVKIYYEYQAPEPANGVEEDLDINFSVDIPDLKLKDIDLADLYVKVWRALWAQIQDVRAGKVDG